MAEPVFFVTYLTLIIHFYERTNGLRMLSGGDDDNGLAHSYHHHTDQWHYYNIATTATLTAKATPTPQQLFGPSGAVLNEGGAAIIVGNNAAMALLRDGSVANGEAGLVRGPDGSGDYDSTASFLYYHTLKSTPVMALAVLTRAGCGDLSETSRTWLARGLFFGAIGDILIGAPGGNIGMALSALAFGCGHLFCMKTFARRVHNISRELVVGVGLFAFSVFHFLMVPRIPDAPIITVLLMAYSGILCAALIASGSLFLNGGKAGEQPRRKDNFIRLVGYALFTVSDFLLFVEHIFGDEILPNPALCILVPYFASQYMILWAEMRRRREKGNNVISSCTSGTTKTKSTGGCCSGTAIVATNSDDDTNKCHFMRSNSPMLTRIHGNERTPSPQRSHSIAGAAKSMAAGDGEVSPAVEVGESSSRSYRSPASGPMLEQHHKELQRLGLQGGNKYNDGDEKLGDGIDDDELGGGKDEKKGAVNGGPENVHRRRTGQQQQQRILVAAS